LVYSSNRGLNGDNRADLGMLLSFSFEPDLSHTSICKKIIDYEDHPKDDFISRESYISSARFAKRIETFFFS
jgi:hypothetical protein